MPLVVVHTHTDEADVLSVIGDIDLSSAPRLITHAADALRRGRCELLVLDLRAVEFMDSRGLSALLNILRRATASGTRLVLADLQPPVARLLHTTRLEREFTIVDRVEQAAPGPAAELRRGAR